MITHYKCGAVDVPFIELEAGRWGCPCLSNENKASNKCKQCGNDNDLMTAFTKYQICGKCTRANYKRATRGR